MRKNGFKKVEKEKKENYLILIDSLISKIENIINNSKNNFETFNKSFVENKIIIEESKEKNNNFMFILKEANINKITKAIENIEKIENIFIARIKS